MLSNMKRSIVKNHKICIIVLKWLDFKAQEKLDPSMKAISKEIVSTKVSKTYSWLKEDTIDLSCQQVLKKVPLTFTIVLSD